MLVLKDLIILPFSSTKLTFINESLKNEYINLFLKIFNLYEKENVLLLKGKFLASMTIAVSRRAVGK
jgi:hypothetical protein